MLIVVVQIRVVPEHTDAFIAASLANAEASRQEPGVVRFDLIREEGSSDRFVLLEVYRTDDDVARHKETEHYATWRRTVEDWMAEPRKSLKYRAISPSDPDSWQHRDPS